MSVWFAKKKGSSQVAMTRFEALDLLTEITNLVNENKFGAAMAKIGMDNVPFADQLTIDELAQIFQVRVIDLAKYAGVKIHEI